MKHSSVTIAQACSLTAALLAACSSQTPTKDPQIPPAQNYDVRIQPARIPPNPQGAFALSSFTGCDVIYVGKTDSPETFTYAVRPTSRVPDAARCASLLSEQPGVVAMAAAR